MLELEFSGCSELDDRTSEEDDLATGFELLEDFCVLLDDDGAVLEEDFLISTLFEK